MTTDEQILALRDKHGFVLPEGLGFHDGVWIRGHHSGHLPLVQEEPTKAHDLCAMAFAAQGCSKRIGRQWDKWSTAMLDGNSAAAIDALYNAMEAK